ncbi:hypothetical protein ACWAUP_000426 [Pseudomonas aeruginosa]
MPSIHFYDALTIGKHPADGQLVRYDSLYCTTDTAELDSISIKLRDDVFVPPDQVEDGDAALIDLAAGVTELKWARIAHRAFATPDCLHVAYGGTGRLEQFVRFSMYRNLLPFPGHPQGLHCLDLETIILAVRLLRPESLPWPGVAMSNLHQFLTWDAKLSGENLAVRGKEVLARLVEAVPKMVEHAMKTSSLPAVRAELGLDGGEVSDLDAVRPALMVHSSIGGQRSAVAAFPVAVDANYPDILFAADLEADLTELCDPTTVDLSVLVRTRPDDRSKPLVRISLSRLPFCSPLKAVRNEDAKRIGMDMRAVDANVRLLRESRFLAARLKEEAILVLPPQPFDVYHRLWAGDFSAAEQERMKALHQSEPKQWLDIAAMASDGRFMELCERLLGREAPSLLPEHLIESWNSQVQSRAAGDLVKAESLASLLKRTEDIANRFPTAVGLVRLHERLVRIFGQPRASTR